MTGKVITTSLNNVKHVTADEYWLITRGGKDILGLSRHLGLSPSPELFARYCYKWRGQDPLIWWPTYRAIFERELQTEEKLTELRAVYRLAQAGKTVALVCYCADAGHCHRTLVGSFLAYYGIPVSEAVPPPRPVQLALNL